MLGLQLGFSYEQGALVPDGSARPAVANAVREFVPSGRPGARLPHAWVRPGVSTLDLVPHDRFLLIAGREGSAWLDAAAGLARAPLATLAIGSDVSDGDGRWTAQLGIDAEGALLVRPDQHVAWRSPRASADPRAALEAALAAILGS
jgi:2,4-dichlorophenol 6-monooxygenase